MLRPIGWACRECGAVYETKGERDMCERFHDEDKAALDDELDECLDPNQ